MRLRTAVFAVAAAALAAGCQSAAESKCQPGWIACGAECVLPRVDPSNCGGCGNVCGATESCVAGACVADCTKQLHAPIGDPWGFAWDGVERPATDHAAARQACLDIGGRLPTASELYRVGAGGTGAVGDTYATNDLWALTPYDAANAFDMGLNDGLAHVVGNGTPHVFRCVCPAPAPAAFSGDACSGPIGEACFNLPYDPRYNLDVDDRPSLSKSGAIWECAFVGAQLASPERLAGAISAGLVGSGAEVHTANDDYVSNDTILKWTGLPWAISGNVRGAAMTDLRPFRCIGAATDSATPVAASGTRFVGLGTGVGADVVERAAGSFTDHLAACVDDGGHLPTGAEIASVAMQGLSRVAGTGDAAWVWTADQGGHNGTNWCEMQYSWSGIASWPGGPTPTTEAVGYAYAGSVTWDYKSGQSRSSRCIYYPLSPAYQLPAGACDLGCWELVRSRSDGTVHVWIDDQDRAAALYADGAKECASRGGTLAHSRDLIEGIRNALPGADAANAYVLTGDIVSGPNAYGVHWTGSTNASYQDNDGHNLGLGTAAPYRCMWTNEIR